MKTLTTVRKELKAIGYKLKIKTNSAFKSIAYIRISDNAAQPSIYCGEEELESWSDLIAYKKDNEADIKAIKKM